MWLETKRLQITKANFGESKMAIFSNVLKIYIYIYIEIYIYIIMKRKGLVFSENTGSGFVFGAEK